MGDVAFKGKPQEELLRIDDLAEKRRSSAVPLRKMA
jgi:hypothetical protein